MALSNRNAMISPMAATISIFSRTIRRGSFPSGPGPSVKPAINANGGRIGSIMLPSSTDQRVAVTIRDSQKTTSAQLAINPQPGGLTPRPIFQEATAIRIKSHGNMAKRP